MKLIKEVGIEVKLPVNIHIDSKVFIQIAANLIYFIREKILKGMVKTEYINTRDQLADQLTKELGKIQHECLSSKIGMLYVFAPRSLIGSV